MSATNAASDDSTDNNRQTDASAARVQRAAEYRQRSDTTGEPPRPATYDIDGDTDALFDEDGSLIEADNAVDSLQATAVTPDDDPEAFLRQHAPGRLETINAGHEGMPFSRDDLLAHHARKVADELDIDADDMAQPAFSLNIRQDQRQATRSALTRLKQADEDTETPDEADTLDECPKCGAENVTAHTVEQQTRAADESGTQITKTGCGCTIRRTD